MCILRPVRLFVISWFGSGTICWNLFIGKEYCGPKCIHWKNETYFKKKYAYVKIWLLYIWTTPTFDLPKEQNIFQMTRPTLKCTTLGKFGLSESGLMLFCPVSRLHSFPNDLRERHYSSVNWTPTKEEDGLRRDKTRKGNLNKKVLKLTIAMFGQRALNDTSVFSFPTERP